MFLCRDARLPLLLGAVLLLRLLPLAHCQPAPAPVEAAGMVLATLGTEDLDALEQATGKRLGVQVVDVKAGSAAAAAGVKAGDILFTVGKTGVASAEQAADALKAATGEVELVAASTADGNWQAAQYKLKLDGTAAAPAGVDHGGGVAAPAGGLGDPIAAYFDMLDFTRTNAWGRTCTTQEAERQRVAQLILAHWDELGAQGQTVILGVPQVWAEVKQQWGAADDARKSELKDTWGKNLLAPNMLYAPPAELQTYRSPGGEVALEYPADWVGAQQEVGGVPMLVLVPPGVETTWDKVLDAPNSPPGVLLALAQKDAQLAAIPTFVDGVRLLAQLLFKDSLAGFKEIGVVDLGKQGAVITYRGKFPGQDEERFYWVGAVPFGESAIVAGRFGGPTAQAEKLVPALHHILGSMKLTPPAPPGGGGSGSGAWDAAWSRVDVAITKNIWAPSGN